MKIQAVLSTQRKKHKILPSRHQERARMTQGVHKLVSGLIQSNKEDLKVSKRDWQNWSLDVGYLCQQGRSARRTTTALLKAPSLHVALQMLISGPLLTSAETVAAVDINERTASSTYAGPGGGISLTGVQATTLLLMFRCSEGLAYMSHSFIVKPGFLKDSLSNFSLRNA